MENNLKFNSAICTSRSQSERLLALGLKKETADIRRPHYNKQSSLVIDKEDCLNEHWLPAWSLHRLMSLIFNSGSTHVDFFEDDDAYETLIYNIEWRIKEGYFPKEYLV